MALSFFLNCNLEDIKQHGTNVANHDGERAPLLRGAVLTFNAVSSLGKCTPQLGRRYDTLLRVRSTTGPRVLRVGGNEVQRAEWGRGGSNGTALRQNEKSLAFKRHEKLPSFHM